jgi:hypothetical protein
MVESGRLAPLPPDIFRVGAEVRPPGSVEAGKVLSFVPFRSDVLRRVDFVFMLLLFLEVLDLMAEVGHRVLKPGGELTVLLPHFGDLDSERNLQHTEGVLRRTFGEVEVDRYPGPFTSFWSDLYQDRTYRLRCVRRSPGLSG